MSGRVHVFAARIESIYLQIILVFTEPSQFPKGPHEKPAEPLPGGIKGFDLRS
jgi:hypothetical protein